MPEETVTNDTNDEAPVEAPATHPKPSNLRPPQPRRKGGNSIRGRACTSWRWNWCERKTGGSSSSICACVAHRVDATDRDSFVGWAPPTT
ncbi:MAG: hypothetical protein JWN40_2645 [Phycisphaerales bacterium]|nr:hypothetical protein [Phycisphaerales bacterium]